jgi:porin
MVPRSALRLPAPLALALASTLFVNRAIGQSGEPAAEALPREWIGGLPYSDWTRATGDWNGLRDDLAAAGIEFGGFYAADLCAPWSGADRRRSSLPSVLDLNVAFDLEAIAGLPRTLFYVDAYMIQGRSPSTDVGDAQGLSSLSSANVEQIAEVWLETWLCDQLRIKAGKIDWNSEFAFREIGGEFVNSTPLVPPTVVAYPTYPNPATAVQAFFVPSDRFYLGAGVFDGAQADGIQTGKRGPRGFFSDDESDAYFYTAELGTGWPGGERWGSGRFALGAYYHSASFATFDGGTDRGTAGLWVNFEQRVWRENPTADDPQGIGVFAGYSNADADVSAFAATFVAGLEWTGPVPGRDLDIFGAGAFWADLSNREGAGTPRDEIAFECFYKVALTPAVSLKPELQYIVNPSGADDANDVLVGLLRLEILF